MSIDVSTFWNVNIARAALGWGVSRQWRRQDLLRGGANMEILCHGALTVDFRAGCSSFVTNAVLMERAVSCRYLHQLISHTTQWLDSWAVRFTPE